MPPMGSTCLTPTLLKFPGDRRKAPFQPTPEVVEVAYLKVGAHTVTGITRRWGLGQSEVCRLCPGPCAAPSKDRAQSSSAGTCPRRKRSFTDANERRLARLIHAPAVLNLTPLPFYHRPR